MGTEEGSRLRCKHNERRTRYSVYGGINTHLQS